MQALKRLFSSNSDPPCKPGSRDGSGKGAKTTLGTNVGHSTSCPEGGRMHAKIDGRYVTILRNDGVLTCIDSICFHAGGPLGIGDIEDVNGNKCLVCPWHFYKIDIRTGEKYYQGLQMIDGKLVGGEWKSNGVRQRVHPVVEEDGKIYVKLSTSKDVAAGAAEGCAGAPGICGGAGPGPIAPEAPPAASNLTAMHGPDDNIESDNYAFDRTCGDRVLNAHPSAGKARLHSSGADGKKPSGQVLRGQYQSGK